MQALLTRGAALAHIGPHLLSLMVEPDRSTQPLQHTALGIGGTEETL